jgi:hypothetical protein
MHFFFIYKPVVVRLQNICLSCRAGPEIWVAQARPNVGCPLLLNIKKKLMQNQGYIVCFFLA